MFWIILLICVFTNTHGSDMQCGKGLINSTPGVTIPEGDINIPHGMDLQIWCHIDLNLTEGLNSSNLVFTKGDKQISEEHTIIINETTLELHIKKPDPSSSMYYCTLRNPETNRNTGVCLNLVTIASPPRPPDNLNCEFQSKQKIICQFRELQNVSLKTEYYITISGQDADGETLSLTKCTLLRLNDTIPAMKIITFVCNVNYDFPPKLIFNVALTNVIGDTEVMYKISRIAIGNWALFL